MERASLILQGVAAILFGIAAIIWPGITIEALVYLFAAFLAINGVAAIILSLSSMGKRPTKGLVMLATGLAEVAIGAAFLFWIDVAFETIVLILALVLVVRGLFSLVHGNHKKESAKLRRTHRLLGALGTLAGLILLAYPVGTVVALTWIVGLYALVAGVLLLAMSADIYRS